MLTQHLAVVLWRSRGFDGPFDLELRTTPGETDIPWGIFPSERVASGQGTSWATGQADGNYKLNLHLSGKRIAMTLGKAGPHLPRLNPLRPRSSPFWVHCIAFWNLKPDQVHDLEFLQWKKWLKITIFIYFKPAGNGFSRIFFVEQTKPPNWSRPLTPPAKPTASYLRLQSTPPTDVFWHPTRSAWMSQNDESRFTNLENLFNIPWYQVCFDICSIKKKPWICVVSWKHSSPKT